LAVRPRATITSQNLPKPPRLSNPAAQTSAVASLTPRVKQERESPIIMEVKTLVQDIRSGWQYTKSGSIGDCRTMAQEERQVPAIVGPSPVDYVVISNFAPAALASMRSTINCGTQVYLGTVS
jgi:hypothetical protein